MKKSYIYADGQILSQRVHTDSQDPNIFTPYFYVHDRLGSIRLVVNSSAAAVCSYTYKPYGQFYDGEAVETIENPWAFTGQYFDREIGQYYLRARQYDPQMMRFTSRDPVLGEQTEPLTLHQYLYCLNEPVNQIDPFGESAIQMGLALVDAMDVYAAGLGVAAYGADTGNFDVIIAGSLIQQLSPLAFAISYATMNTACFTAGTEVLTPCGEIPIEQIQKGWLVWSTDPTTGKLELCQVMQCFKREVDKLVVVTVGNEIIKATPEHPFYVYGQGWCQAGNLEIGTELTDVNGNPVQVDKIEYVDGHTVVYNLEIDQSHTYYVSDARLLVHNGPCASPNQILKMIERGQAPKGIARLDKAVTQAGRIIDDIHVHLENGSALYKNGVWKHGVGGGPGPGEISKDALQWLIDLGGWTAPK